MDRIALGVFIGIAAAYFYGQSVDRQQTLSSFVSTLPRNSLNIPKYWLEMRNSLGEWEQMILVSGYADNKSVCDALHDYAKKDSPNRLFICSAAN